MGRPDTTRGRTKAIRAQVLAGDVRGALAAAAAAFPGAVEAHPALHFRLCLRDFIERAVALDDGAAVRVVSFVCSFVRSFASPVCV